MQSNFYPEIDDWNGPWARRPNTFDLICGRRLLGLVRSWPDLAAGIHTSLKPGGWFEGRERSFHFTGNNTQPLPAESLWCDIWRVIEDLQADCSFDITESNRYEECLETAGFVNISVYRRPVRVKDCFEVIWGNIDCLLRFANTLGCDRLQSRYRSQSLQQDLLAESDDVWTDL
jgi:hypothetical protein